MKRLCSLLLSIVVTLSCASITAIASDDVNVILDGEILEFDVPPQIIDGRTLVPLRKIFEELDMVVDWDGDTQTVSADKLGVSVKLTIGETTAYRNSVANEIDVPAMIIDERTLVPARLVSEYAGADVRWDGDTRTVYITSSNVIQEINWSKDFTYFGEVENSKANGYGILYDKNSMVPVQMGIYIDSVITKGSDYYDNGEFFTGDFKDGKWSEGTFYYSSGNYYTGEFLNSQRSGNGKFFYSDGSFHKGKWENNLPNGYGIFYDAIEDVQYQGNYVNGNKEGRFLVDDFYTGTSQYVYYESPSDTTVTVPSTNQNDYETEYDALMAWAAEKTIEIQEEGKKIYQNVYDEKLSEAYAMYNIDSSSDPSSFAYANAMRQVNALKPNIIAAAEIAQKEYEANEMETLALYVATKASKLKQKYNIK